MNVVRARLLLSVGVVAVAVLTVACGSRQGSSPSAPSAAGPVPAASASGATISGTVVGTLNSSGWTVQAVRMTVSVTGSASTSTVDDSGHFLLQNVPSGHVDLHFMGAGVDAHLTLDGIADHQTIQITVRVSGNTAELEDNNRQGPDNNVELEGLVTAVGSTTLVVLGRTVNVGASTQIVHGDKALTLSSIHVGDRIHVRGNATSANGPVMATKIEVQNQVGKNPADDDDEDDDGKVEVKGAIVANSLAGSCAANSLSFRIASTTVRTNAQTKFEDTTCGGLKAGDVVEVKGSKQSDGSVLAMRVEKE